MPHKLFAHTGKDPVEINDQTIVGERERRPKFLRPANVCSFSDSWHPFMAWPLTHTGIVAVTNTPGDYFWDGNARAGRSGSRPRLQGVCSTERCWESGTRGISQRSGVSRNPGRNPFPTWSPFLTRLQILANPCCLS